MAKISKIIERLEFLKQKHGDLEVKYNLHGSFKKLKVDQIAFLWGLDKDSIFIFAPNQKFV